MHQNDAPARADGVPKYVIITQSRCITTGYEGARNVAVKHGSCISFDCPPGNGGRPALITIEET
jgi:hypothetical protein